MTSQADQTSGLAERWKARRDAQGDEFAEPTWWDLGEQAEEEADERYERRLFRA